MANDNLGNMDHKDYIKKLFEFAKKPFSSLDRDELIEFLGLLQTAFIKDEQCIAHAFDLKLGQVSDASCEFFEDAAHKKLAEARLGILNFTEACFLPDGRGRVQFKDRIFNLPYDPEEKEQLPDYLESVPLFDVSFIKPVRKAMAAMKSSLPEDLKSYNRLDYLADTSFDYTIYYLYLAKERGSKTAAKEIKDLLGFNTRRNLLAVYRAANATMNSAKLEENCNSLDERLKEALTDPNFSSFKEIMDCLKTVKSSGIVDSILSSHRILCGRGHKPATYVPFYYAHLILALALKEEIRDILRGAPSGGHINPAALLLDYFLNIRAESSDHHFIDGIIHEWAMSRELPKFREYISETINDNAMSPATFLLVLGDILRFNDLVKGSFFDEEMLGITPHAAYLIGRDLITGTNVERNLSKGLFYLTAAHTLGHPYAAFAIEIAGGRISAGQHNEGAILAIEDELLNSLLNVQSLLSSRAFPIPVFEREDFISEDTNPYFNLLQNFFTIIAVILKQEEIFGAVGDKAYEIFNPTTTVMVKHAALDFLQEYFQKIKLSKYALSFLRFITYAENAEPTFYSRVVDSVGTIFLLWFENELKDSHKSKRKKKQSLAVSPADGAFFVSLMNTLSGFYAGHFNMQEQLARDFPRMICSLLFVIKERFIPKKSRINFEDPMIVDLLAIIEEYRLKHYGTIFWDKGGRDFSSGSEDNFYRLLPSCFVDRSCFEEYKEIPDFGLIKALIKKDDPRNAVVLYLMIKAIYTTSSPFYQFVCRDYAALSNGENAVPSKKDLAKDPPLRDPKVLFEEMRNFYLKVGQWEYKGVYADLFEETINYIKKMYAGKARERKKEIKDAAKTLVPYLFKSKDPRAYLLASRAYRDAGMKLEANEALYFSQMMGVIDPDLGVVEFDERNRLPDWLLHYDFFLRTLKNSSLQDSPALLASFLSIFPTSPEIRAREYMHALESNGEPCFKKSLSRYLGHFETAASDDKAYRSCVGEMTGYLSQLPVSDFRRAVSQLAYSEGIVESLSPRAVKYLHTFRMNEVVKDFLFASMLELFNCTAMGRKRKKTYESPLSDYVRDHIHYSGVITEGVFLDEDSRESEILSIIATYDYPVDLHNARSMCTGVNTRYHRQAGYTYYSTLAGIAAQRLAELVFLNSLVSVILGTFKIPLAKFEKLYQQLEQHPIIKAKEPASRSGDDKEGLEILHFGSGEIARFLMRNVTLPLDIDEMQNYFVKSGNCGDLMGAVLGNLNLDLLKTKLMGEPRSLPRPEKYSDLFETEEFLMLREIISQLSDTVNGDGDGDELEMLGLPDPVPTGGAGQDSSGSSGRGGTKGRNKNKKSEDDKDKEADGKGGKKAGSRSRKSAEPMVIKTDVTQ